MFQKPSTTFLTEQSAGKVSGYIPNTIGRTSKSWVDIFKNAPSVKKGMCVSDIAGAGRGITA
jgi:hypothetical protein